MEIQGVNEQIFPLILMISAGAVLMSLSVIFFFIQYQKKLLAQKEQIQKAELLYKEQLVHSNISSQEEERLRISKDLHDHIGSSLSHLRLLVAHVDRAIPPGHEISRLTQEYRTTIDTLIDDVRNISHTLAPHGLALWGLQDTLEDLCEKTGRISSMKITVTDDTGGMLRHLSFNDALGIYRVIQELINNTVKHAGADSVSVATTNHNDDMVRITYKDNGNGFKNDMKHKHGIGMRNIESRLSMIGAQHNVSSSPGQGFLCDIFIPLSCFDTHHAGE